jgi:23S rRNA pseudouridine955/2504/2580 synthase
LHHWRNLDLHEDGAYTIFHRILLREADGNASLWREYYTLTSRQLIYTNDRANYILKMKDLEGISPKGAEKPPSKRPSGAPPSVQLLSISEEEVGQRIDNFLLRICKGVPKSHIYRILRSGEVRVNKGRIDQTYRLELGDQVRVPPMRMAEKAIKAAPTAPAADFTVLYEDSHLLVINKPAGVAVHGGSGISYGVIEQLRAKHPDAKFLELVHRLDRETSGILVLAKKRSALTNLHEQVREGTVDKRYLTLVHGDWKNTRQHVKLPLHKYSTAEGERRVRVQEGGMASHTVFNLLHKFDDYALLEAELKTGRTHQIRVHLSSSGFAIAGDDKYGDFALNRTLQKADSKRTTLKRMFLHAHQITFTHPETGKPITINAPLAEECDRFLRSLKEPSSEEP